MLPPRCRLDLRSSGILRSLQLWFCTDISEQPFGPIFKVQEVQDCSKTSVQNYHSTLPNIQKSADIISEQNSVLLTSLHPRRRTAFADIYNFSKPTTWFNVKQVRQSTYNVTLRRVHVTIVAVQNNKHYIF
jgi:hypothetical protein